MIAPRRLLALIVFCLFLPSPSATGQRAMGLSEGLPKNVQVADEGNVSVGKDMQTSRESEDPRRCLEESDDDVDWDTNVDLPVVRIMLEYENICKRPLRCKVTVQSGYRPSGASRDDYSDWKVRDILSFKFSIAPEEKRRLLTTLFWEDQRPKDTTIHLRMPSMLLSRNLHLMECSFTDSEAAKNRQNT